MEATYLEPPKFGITKAGWYVLENDRILAGPFATEADAEIWIENNEEDVLPPPSP